MGSKKTYSDEELIDAWSRFDSLRSLAVHFGVSLRSVQLRVAELRSKGAVLLRPEANAAYNAGKLIKVYSKAYPKRIQTEVSDGVVMVGSDIHKWPGYESTAQRAFIHFAKHLRPAAIVLNGDLLDFASISRHHRIGWAHIPTPVEELDSFVPWIQELEKAAPGAQKYRTPGNHCLRLEGWLSNREPQAEGLPGSKLSYWMPNWKSAWAIHFNNQLWVTHRWKGGKHAPYRNAMEAGQSICTGHLHNQHVRAYTDLNGTRWGMDTGCMAEPFIEEDWPQFEYLEGNPTDWRSGFGIWTFEDGQLVDAELVSVLKKGTIRFRGTKLEI